MKITVSAIQMCCEPGQVKENCLLAERLIQEAAQKGAELIVLPEFWNTGYDDGVFRQLSDYASEMQSYSVDMLRNAAKENHVYLVGGSIPEKKGNDFFNTSLFLDPEGHILDKYRKVHLFRSEKQFFSPGEEWTIVPFSLAEENFSLGMCTCYDLRFPEFFRNLALRGTGIFSLPVAWPASRIREYRIFCQARAAENRCFLISANHTGEGTDYSGHSMIVDPLGHILAEGESTDDMIFAELDLDMLHSKKIFYSLEDRRHFLDEIDDTLL